MMLEYVSFWGIAEPGAKHTESSDDLLNPGGEMDDHMTGGPEGLSRRTAMKGFGAGAAAVAAAPLLGGLLLPTPAQAATATTSPGGPVMLVNVLSGCLLDVYGGETTDGASVIQWTPTGGANQQWTPVDQGDGWVTITSANSGEVLDVYGGGTADGTAVIQWHVDGGTNQEWQLVDAGQGRVKIVSRPTGKLLSAVGSSATPGAGMEIRADSGDPGQLWKAVPVGSHPLDTAATEARTDLLLPGFGGVGGGVAYGVTHNGWTRDGQPWYPVSGEFHYVRYPAYQRWGRELGKLRAAGISIVSTYVFWNHHEQPQGTWDWTGRRDLGAFIAAAQRQGLLVWLRVGPYINAEATNGGLPSFALSGARTNDPGYLNLVGLYFDQIAAQVKGLFVKDGGPIVGIQLENEFQGDPAHITTLRQMCVDRGMVVPYYSVTANSSFTPDTAIPLQGTYCYRGWEPDGGTTPVSGFIYGTDEWTANTDTGGTTYNTLDYPRGFCELGTGSPMSGTDRFLVERPYVVAASYDCLGRGANFLGYYMFHGGTQVAGLSGSWPLTYDFQAPLGEFGQTRDDYRYYRRLHTFVTTCADDLVGTRVSRDPVQIMDPTQTTRLRYIGRFDAKGRGFVFVNNTQLDVTMPLRDDMRIQISGPTGTINLPVQPLTMPAERSNLFPVMTDLNGVDLRWATVEPMAKLAGDDLPTWVYWAPDWTSHELAFDSGVTLTKESGTFTQKVTGAERIATVPADQRTSLLVRKAGQRSPCARIIVLGEADSLDATVAPLNGRDRLIVAGAALLSGLRPTVRFSAAAGSTITADIFPSRGLKPAAGWNAAPAAQRGAALAPFARYSYRLAAAPPAPEITPVGTGQWRITTDPAALAQLAEAQLVLDYRGGDATLVGAGTEISNDLYHGESWTIDLNNLDAPSRADLVLQVSAWDSAIEGIPQPTGPMPDLPSWSWNPRRDAVWGQDPSSDHRTR